MVLPLRSKTHALTRKQRVKCNDDDTVGDLKKLIAAQTGTASYVTDLRDELRAE